MDNMRGIEPSEIGRVLRSVTRPIARSRWALESAGEPETRTIAIDDIGGKKRSDLEMKVTSPAVSDVRERTSDSLSLEDLLTKFEGKLVIEMAVH